MEYWKTCIDHNKDYMISNYGNVLSFKRDKINGKVIKPVMNAGGYLQASFADYGIPDRYLVHTLVMYYFYGPRPYKLDIDHINRIRHDNRISNLRYTTRRENCMNKTNNRLDILERDPIKRKKIMAEVDYELHQHYLEMCREVAIERKPL